MTLDYTFKNQSLLLTIVLLHCLQVLQAQNNEFNYPIQPDTLSSSSYAVGTPEGSLSVSSLGAAIYTMPIEVPKGSYGRGPQVSISYNSQSGNGVVGYGCNISGVSVITRGARDIYHDSLAVGIGFTVDDAFYLDGQRLIEIQPSGGSDSIVYCLENSPYTRVILYGVNGSSQSSLWFRMISTDGMVYEYGKYYNSRLQISANVLAWYLSRSLSPLGAEISYSYLQSDNCVYPSSISYGSNNISFEYEQRPDTLSYALCGGIGKMGKRLKHLTSRTYTSSGFIQYRKYGFNYSETLDTTQTKYSRLTSVTLANSSGEQVKPTTFNWSPLPAYTAHLDSIGFDLQPFDARITEVVEDESQLMAADLTGDGIPEIIQKSHVKFRPGDNRVYDYTDFFIRRGSRSNNGSVVYNLDDTVSYRLPASYIVKNWAVRNEGPMITDIDGDGLGDIIVPYAITGSNHVISFYYIYGKNVCTSDKSIFVKNYFFQHSNEVPVYGTSDFDNDGLSDIVVLEAGNESGNSYDCHILTGATIHGNIAEQHFILTIPGKPKRLFTSDFNADGMSDIMVVHSNGYSIFWNNGNGINSSTFSDSSRLTSSLLIDGYRMYEGDFNGDGILDFLITYQNNSTWNFAIGNGNGGFTLSAACNINAYDVSNTTKDDAYFCCNVFDIDGDGKSDAIISKAEYIFLNIFSHVNTYWLLSNGKTLVTNKTKTSDKEYHASPQYYMIADFNGDGLAELATYGYSAYSGNTPDGDQFVRMHYNNYYTSNMGKVTKIVNGFSKQTLVDYATFSTADMYEKGTGGAYPAIKVTLPINAVKEVSDVLNYSDTLRTTYHYGGLMCHLQGKGIMGLSSIRNTNMVTGTQSENKVTQWNTEAFCPGTVVERVSVGVDTSIVTQKIKFHRPYSGKKAFLQYTDSVVTRDLDGNPSLTTYSYDLEKGVPLAETTEHECGQISKTYSAYQFKGGRWQPGEFTESRKYQSQPTFSTTKSFSYNDKGLCTSIVDRASSTSAVTTNMTYDSYGNLLTSTTSAADVETVTKSYQYDISHRFVTKSIERGYIEKEYTYDLWGNMLSMTDKTRPAHSQTTLYTYDGWGRVVSELMPTGEKTTNLYGWSNNGTFFSVSQGTSMPWVKTWYDCIGREISSETMAALNLKQINTISYNLQGNVSEKTLIKRDGYGEAAYTDRFSYDTRGRLTTEQLHSGLTTDYSYAGNVITSTTDGRQTIKRYDAWGNLLEVTDPVGTVTSYTYGSHGSPLSVSNASGNTVTTVTMVYDEAGRQTRLVDPDAGTMSYAYDAYGRIVRQSNGRGYITWNTYDDKGRLTQSKTGNIATNYSYGETVDDRGLLLSTTRQTNSESYTYDAYGRLVQKKRDGSVFNNRSFMFTYGDKGLLTEEQYPDGLTVSYEYDAYGNKVATYVGDSLIWSLQENMPDAIIENYGQNMQIGILKNSVGLPTTKSMFSNDDWSFGYNFDYDYDVHQNVTYRNGMFPEDEIFTYDCLDRLVSTNYIDSHTHSVSYADNGNITYQTGIGRYYYDNSRPHAVAAVENMNNKIPHAPQTISYNAFGKVSLIADENNGGRMAFSYGPDDQRWQSVLQIYGRNRVIRYFDNYEEIQENGQTRCIHYLDGNALYITQANRPDSIFYMFTDLQGSITAILDYDRNEVFRAAYDAWGNQTVYHNDIGFHRGYTGHEMMPEFGLINMNGRLYDPLIGRFLSTDNYVQEPLNSQNFNRYSYCLNNPLKYTDPSGEMFVIDELFLFNLAVNIYTNVCTSIVTGGNLWKSAFNAVTTSVVSLGASYATNGIGSLFGHTIGGFGAELLRAGAHGVVGGVASNLTGGSFKTGFWTSFASSLAGSTVSALGGNSNLTQIAMMATGALTSTLSGGNWLDGMMTGLNIGMLNHEWETLPDGTPHCTLDEVIITGLDKRINSLSYIASMATRTLSKGILQGMNKNNKIVFSIEALSGSQKSFMTLPSGEYYASQYVDTTDPRFTRNGVGFKVVIGPDPYDSFLGRKRTYLRIHPARGNSTQGCIGLTTEDVEELLSIERIFKSSLQYNNSIPLKVVITGR